MSERAVAWIIFVSGVVLALISIFADVIGVGREPGFGWKQTLGLVVGLGLTAYGFWRYR
jgi:uncharacterized membrane protein